MRDNFNKNIPQTQRVVKDTNKILDLLDSHKTKGTFFVLGQVAEAFPGLIKRISSEGHELGVHGYDHLLFHKMDYKKAYNELDKAKKIIEDIGGQEVCGHRAPAFSINKNTSWGLDVVAEVGFLYDSSVMPSNVARNGWPEYDKDICLHTTEKGRRLIEVPMSIAKIFNKDVPVGGGSYLRLFPYELTKHLFKKIQEHRPVILYVHPYEVDNQRYPDFYFDELAKANWQKRNKMKSYWINRQSVYPKLNNLLSNNKFDTVKNILIEKNIHF
jgi:polysaccharide deacetylase family protein (PEP-CTERM system associated)